MFPDFSNPLWARQLSDKDLAEKLTQNSTLSRIATADEIRNALVCEALSRLLEKTIKRRGKVS